MKVPEWIGRRAFSSNTHIKSLLKELSLNTICESAKCPNINECFGKGSATFLILGNICTRNCGFCNVKHGVPTPIDKSEPYRVAEAVKRLGLLYVVITSVTRDDLPDGGASQFITTVAAIRKQKTEDRCQKSDVRSQKTEDGRQGPDIELLLPILENRWLNQIVAIQPKVMAHNIETVPRLYAQVRPCFNYSEAIKFLNYVKRADNSILTKSGIMVGLGETQKEVIEVMNDLRAQGVNILTIGQYLKPSGRQLPVVEYVQPAQFDEYKRIGQEMGFKYVASAPYVRSSYKAWEGESCS
ncbi:MAG: lipoyl synthase [Candidatus Stahlbacteria bacterium]|nr:lipoyl synthase [Candidatus Stahlbacteria bacterium]